jgi:chromosome segregation ATPase
MTKVAFEKEEKVRKEIEDNSLKLAKEKNDLYTELQAERDNMSVVEQRMEKLIVQKSDLETQLLELEEKLGEEESQVSELQRRGKKLEADVVLAKKENEEVGVQLKRAECDNKAKEGQIASLQEDLTKHTETINKVMHGLL